MPLKPQKHLSADIWCPFAKNNISQNTSQNKEAANNTTKSETLPQEREILPQTCICFSSQQTWNKSSHLRVLFQDEIHKHHSTLQEDPTI